MNLRECVWEIRYRIIIKTVLQEKDLMPQAMKNSCSESSRGQGMGKIGEIFGVESD